MLAQALDKPVEVTSAGLEALVGEPADATTNAVAAAHGVCLLGHVARQYSTRLGLEQDLILVMEPVFREVVAAEEPALLGRTLLYDQWSGATGIPDPYRRARSVHEHVFQQIAAASQAWAARLATAW